jgi:hypothetical protein
MLHLAMLRVFTSQSVVTNLHAVSLSRIRRGGLTLTFSFVLRLAPVPVYTSISARSILVQISGDALVGERYGSAACEPRPLHAVVGRR